MTLRSSSSPLSGAGVGSVLDALFVELTRGHSAPFTFRSSYHRLHEFTLYWRRQNLFQVHTLFLQWLTILSRKYLLSVLRFPLLSIISYLMLPSASSSTDVDIIQVSWLLVVSLHVLVFGAS